MWKEAFRQFLGSIMTVQIETKGFGKARQRHHQEIETVNETHVDMGYFYVHQFASSKDDLWH